MPGGREGARIGAGLRDQVPGGRHAEPGDAVELGDLVLARLAEGGDPLVAHRDLRGVTADAVQHHLQDERVPGSEEGAVEGQPLGDLVRVVGGGQPGWGCAPGDRHCGRARAALDHRPTGTVIGFARYLDPV